MPFARMWGLKLSLSEKSLMLMERGCACTGTKLSTRALTASERGELGADSREEGNFWHALILTFFSATFFFLVHAKKNSHRQV
jgi:hypothetical protein